MACRAIYKNEFSKQITFFFCEGPRSRCCVSDWIFGRRKHSVLLSEMEPWTGPTHILVTVNGYRVLPGDKAAGAWRSFFFVVKVPAADATDAPQPKASCATLWWRWKMISFFFIFTSNGAAVKWNWQGKTEVLGEKPVPVPLCSPQIPRGLTRDRTRASAVRGRRLNVARPSYHSYHANI